MFSRKTDIVVLVGSAVLQFGMACYLVSEGWLYAAWMTAMCGWWNLIGLYLLESAREAKAVIARQSALISSLLQLSKTYVGFPPVWPERSGDRQVDDVGVV